MGTATYLVITDFVQVNIFVNILAECTAVQFLRVLHLYAGRPFDVDRRRARTQRVILSTLTEFHISVRSGSHFLPMLDIFQFPNLESLWMLRLTLYA